MGSNNQMLPMLLLLACCCCSSSASGAGAYFLGYVPGNDKYYIRIFQLEKMFQILEDIKKDMVYEGTAPTEYTGKIEKDFCDKIKDFKENLDEKRDDEIEKVSDTDFKKLVKTYMEDNEIKGYTSKQATDIIDFLYASCGTDDKRVFKKTAAFTTKLTKLFKATPDGYANFAPSTQYEADRVAFCNTSTLDDITTKGFTDLHKEIVTDITAVSSLGQVWDESTGTLVVPSGFSLTGLTSSVDYCSKDFTPVTPPTCDSFTEKTPCDAVDTCLWDTTTSLCGDKPATGGGGTNILCTGFTEETPCDAVDTCLWDTTTSLCGDKPVTGGV